MRWLLIHQRRLREARLPPRVLGELRLSLVQQRYLAAKTQNILLLRSERGIQAGYRILLKCELCLQVFHQFSQLCGFVCHGASRAGVS